jgi:hypothetical protein
VGAAVLDGDLESVIRIERKAHRFDVAFRFDAMANTVTAPVVQGCEVTKRSRRNEFGRSRTPSRERVTGGRIEDTGVVVTDDSFTKGGIFADSRSAHAGKPAEVARRVIQESWVAAITRHRDAEVFSAFVVVLADDAFAEGRVFAQPRDTQAGEATKVARRIVGDRGEDTLAVGGIAEVLGALVVVIARHAFTELRVFALTGPAEAGEVSEVARRIVGDRGKDTLAVDGIAEVFGALVVVIAGHAFTEPRVFALTGPAEAG